MYITIIQGRDSVMTWGAMTFRDTLFLAEIEGNMNLNYYCKVLEDALMTVVDDEVGEIWTLEQNGSSLNRSKYTKKCLSDKDVHVLQCPAKSSDLKRIEIVLAVLSREVYKDGRYYESFEDLQDSIDIDMANIDYYFIKKLYKSIPRRLTSVVEKTRNCTKY